MVNYRLMVDVDTGRFTVGVFQDAAWAKKGIAALEAIGIPAEALSIVSKETPENAALFEDTFNAPGDRLEIARSRRRARARAARRRSAG